MDVTLKDEGSYVIKFNVLPNEFINKAFKTIITTSSLDDSISELYIDGIAMSPNNITELSANKTYELKVKAKDKADNESESTVTFTLDTILPKILINNLQNNFYYNKNVQPAIKFEDTNIQYTSILLNGKSYTGQVITDEGNYQLRLVAVDKANNTTEEILNFVVDKTAPKITISGVDNKGIYDSTIKPSVSIDDTDSLYSLILDGENYDEELVGKNGKHTLIVKATDEAGNPLQKVVVFFIDKTNSQITISGITNEKHYSSSVKPIIRVEDDSSLTMTLDGNPYKGGEISKNGEHELIVMSKDKFGNESKKVLKFYVERKTLPISPNNAKSLMFIIIAAIALIPGLNKLLKRKKHGQNSAKPSNS